MARAGTCALVQIPTAFGPDARPARLAGADRLRTAPVSSMDDAALIPLAARGDRAACQALVERHRALVYRLAYQFAGNHHDADDIAQEVFLKVFRSLKGFRHDAQFTSWLYRIVMNACVDHARRRNPADPTADGDGELDRREAEAPDPEAHAYAGELRVALLAAVERLPPRQRVIFTMRHFEGLKLLEIAEALGLAEGTVKRQLHAAVLRLRGILRRARVHEGGRPG
jgi:RNA polymerase sigma-70 factor (ECF subfamily)